MLILVVGLASSAGGVVRWVKTRYRVTATHVERRTGLFVRKYRSVLRERVRSVEAEARFRHRLFGLRMVKIGAGQQNTSGESALALDAISRRGALRLRERLLEREDGAPATAVRQVGGASSERPVSHRPCIRHDHTEGRFPNMLIPVTGGR
ncbi:PH domain-containing protein [Nocardiopsis oceani]